MNPMKSVNLIRESLIRSNLHFFVNESPHSMWITIRKRFLDNQNPSFYEETFEEIASEKAVTCSEKTEARYKQVNSMKTFAVLTKL